MTDVKVTALGEKVNVMMSSLFIGEQLRIPLPSAQWQMKHLWVPIPLCSFLGLDDI